MVVRRDVWMTEDAKTNSNTSSVVPLQEREGGGQMPFNKSGAGPPFSNVRPNYAETQLVESLCLLGDAHPLRPARTSPGEYQCGPHL